MVKWQEVGRVISAVHHHGHQGLKTSEIQRLVRQHPQSGFDFKQALEEAVRTGFLMVRNRRFYPCNWQELVTTRKKGPRLPRGSWSDSCTDVESARRRSSRPRRRRRGRQTTKSRRRSSRSFAGGRDIEPRYSSNSSYSSRRRRTQRSGKRRRKVSRSRRRTRAHGRKARAGSNKKVTPYGPSGVTPAEHATGKNYPPQ